MVVVWYYAHSMPHVCENIKSMRYRDLVDHKAKLHVVASDRQLPSGKAFTAHYGLLNYDFIACRDHLIIIACMVKVYEKS